MSKKESSRFDALFGAARDSQTEQPTTTDMEEVAAQAIEITSAELPRVILAEEEQTTGAENQALAKSKDPNCQRTTLYLARALHRQFKSAAAAEGKEMSDIMEGLIQGWLRDRT